MLHFWESKLGRWEWTWPDLSLDALLFEIISLIIEIIERPGWPLPAAADVCWIKVPLAAPDIIVLGAVDFPLKPWGWGKRGGTGPPPSILARFYLRSLDLASGGFLLLASESGCAGWHFLRRAMTCSFIIAGSFNANASVVEWEGNMSSWSLRLAATNCWLLSIWFSNWKMSISKRRTWRPMSLFC